MATVRRTWWKTALGLLFTAVMLFPLYWMINVSFTQRSAIRNGDLFPRHFTLDHYQVVLHQQLPFLGTSMLVGLGTVALTLIISAPAGYALSKLVVPGRRVLSFVLLVAQMIPAVVMALGFYTVYTRLGILDTLPGLILPFLVSPFGVFLMRQYISTLPRDLLDAARVDGAGELSIFWRIILPLCGPALATLGILTFLGSWNNFLWPLVVAQTEDTYTLPVALALYSTGQNSTQYGLLLAGATVVVLPVLVVFLVFQRRFIEGIATTGIK